MFFILTFWPTISNEESFRPRRIGLHSRQSREVVWYVVQWVAVAVACLLGALTQVRRWPISAVLLAMSVIGPAANQDR